MASSLHSLKFVMGFASINDSGDLEVTGFCLCLLCLHSLEQFSASVIFSMYKNILGIWVLL
jgi:hypothetical protein